jgi:hypothetical protein
MRGAGRVRLSLSPAAGLTAAVLTAAVLAGCASPAATSTPGATSTAVPLTNVSTPAGGAPAQAVGLARQLLDELALPPGVRAIKLPSVPGPARPPWSTAAGSVDAGRLMTARQAMADVRAFLLRHWQVGASVTATGHEDGQTGLIAQYLYFDLTPPPSGIDEEDLSIVMMPRPAGGTLIAAYDRVTWFPARTATEHLDARDLRSVTVSALFLNPRPHRLTRTVTSATIIAGLASLLNGLQAAPDTAMSCPAMTASYKLSFDPVEKQAPPVVVSTGICDFVQVAILGISQPALFDEPGAVTAEARQLLRLPPEAE